MRQFQRTGFPVAPAIGGCEVLGQSARELIGVLPATQAQQQAQAPFGHGVVTQFRVVFGHDLQRAVVITTCQGQTDFLGNLDLLFAGEMHGRGIAIEHRQGFLRVLLGEPAQAETDHVGHRFVYRGKLRRIVDHLRFLRDSQQQASLRCQRVEAVHQRAGQAVIARLRRQLGTLPALLISQLACGRPLGKETVTGGG